MSWCGALHHYEKYILGKNNIQAILIRVVKEEIQ